MSQEFIVGLVVSMVLGLIGFLLKRSIDNLDDKLDTTCTAVDAMEKKMVGYQMLTEYLKQDVDSLKNENNSLRKSFNEIDKIIFAQGLRTGHPVPPPRP